jgi:ATP-dependent Clp protease ATP-binding subunit ClpA
MFASIKAKLRDMRTIKQLCEAAEAHALSDHQRKPGAEHFLLAALDLSDGTAELAFKRVGADPARLNQAIEQQYRMALQSIGLSVELQGMEALPQEEQSGVYNSAASGTEVMQCLASQRRDHAPLLGAHVVAIIAAMPSGVAARALRTMNIDTNALRAAAEEAADSHAFA